MGLTADQAIRMTPLLLAGVILAGGFAVVAHLAPGRDVSKPVIEPIGPFDGEEGVDIDASWPQTDWLALSDTLRGLNHNLIEDETEQLPVPRDPGTGPTTGGGSENGTIEYVGQVQYLGAILGASSPAALIEIGGRQRFVRAGDEIADHEIVSIHADHLIVKVDDEERRVSLADPGRSSLDSAARYRQDVNRAAEQQRGRAERDRRSRPEAIVPDRDR